MERDNIGDHLDPEAIEVVDPAAPDLHQGDRTNPEDTSLPPSPQGEFDDEGPSPDVHE